MLPHNPYDFIIIQQNVIPEEHIEEIMLLTNDKKNIYQATIINDVSDDPEDTSQKKTENDTNLEIRNTLWYSITNELSKKLEEAVATCFMEIVVPKYQCEFKSYEPVQFLGYPPGGHYKAHNDGETFNYETRKWEPIMPRDVSFLFYLNDQYGGGELEFPELGLTIKPKKGMMIAFPSYKEFTHKVHPVTWGHRYSLVSWVATQKHLYDTIPHTWIPKD